MWIETLRAVPLARRAWVFMRDGNQEGAVMEYDDEVWCWVYRGRDGEVVAGISSTRRMAFEFVDRALAHVARVGSREIR